MSTTTALRAAATGASVDQAQRAPRSIFDLLDDKRTQAGLIAVAGKFLNPERMLRLCTNAVRKTPKLAQCEPASVLGAMMASAALGLEPNTVQQQAFLIPYKRRAFVDGRWTDVLECQFQIGYRGFVTLIYRSPLVARLTAGCVRAGDHFAHREGSKSFLEYEIGLDGRGALRAAFSYVEMREQRGESAVVLPSEEVMKIRGRSETYRSALRAIEQAQSDKDRAKAEAALAETPWILWEDEMATKTAIKRHAKLLPVASSDLLLAAAEIDSQGDAGRLDLRSFTDPDFARSVILDETPIPTIEHADPPPPVSSETFGRRDPVEVDRGGDGRPEPDQAERAAGARDGAAEPAKRGKGASGSAPAPRASTAAPSPQAAAAAPPAPPTYAELADRISKAKDADEAALELDAARAILPADLLADLAAHYRRTWASD